MAETKPSTSSVSYDLLLRALTPLLTLVTVIVGLYQFNRGQHENKLRELNMRQLEINKMTNQTNKEILTKYKENQNKIYAEAMAVIGYIATHTDYKAKEYQESLEKFEQFYWVGLSPVSTPEVDTAVMYFHSIVNNLKLNDFRNIEDKQTDLEIAADSVASVMRKSSRDYRLPGGLIGLENK